MAQRGVIFEDLTVKSDGSKAAINISEGSEVLMLRCRVEGAGNAVSMVWGKGNKLEAVDSYMHGEVAGLCVALGGKVVLERCDCSGGMGGWSVWGAGTTLEARGGRAKGSRGYANAIVSAAATAVMTCCCLVGSEDGCGLVVQGFGSSVTALHCRISDNFLSNVFASDGGLAILDGCECKGSRKGAGVHTRGRGSLVLAKCCSLEGNKRGRKKKVHVCPSLLARSCISRG